MKFRYLFVGIYLTTTILALAGCVEDGADSGSTGTVSSIDSRTEDSANGVDSGDEENQIQSGILTAGDIDDNLNFYAFMNHINSILQVDVNQVFPNIDLVDRITIQVVDVNGEGVSNARLKILDNTSSILFEALTTTGGIFYFFPTIDGIVNE
ncbi:MAG: hypothetical protein COA78_25640 [Blastopirellula sp.]|nr:MAG: hypothetical protein COA78_25640 [Blastopirellula sp.]